MSKFGTPESVYEDNARKASFDKKHKAKTRALKKMKLHSVHKGEKKSEMFGDKSFDG